MSDTLRTEEAERPSINGGDKIDLPSLCRQLERELALKDADLLLERDRAEKAEQAFNEWENKAGQYREERDKAEKELETERMRLAGCSAAALGYFYGCSEEYKSASLSDVLALRERYDKAVSAYKEVSEQKLKAEAQIKMLVEASNKLSSAIGWSD